MMQQVDIEISEQTLDTNRCFEFVHTADAGGIDIFIGTVRNQTADKKVVRLEFEGYVPMAKSEILKIAEQMIRKWPVHRISIHHRLGVLQIGELAVVIAVSAAHRDAAFQACRYAIDTLKKTVPIWKKEIFEDGAVWVAAHP